MRDLNNVLYPILLSLLLLLLLLWRKHYEIYT